MRLKSFRACFLASVFLSLAATVGVQAEPAMPPELVDALAGKYKGRTVTAFGLLAGAEKARFEDSLKPFTEKTGIQFQYEGSKQFEATIATRVDANNPPDLADFPQPGLVAAFARAGKLIDLNAALTTAYLEGQYAKNWIDISTAPGPDGKPIFAGLWERVNVKSLIWYPKKAFDAAGYKVPQTWADLKALQEQIIADGDTPWCIGIESGVATGWPATDWVEAILLRTTSLENYDRWTMGKLPFASPEVRRAMDLVADIWFDDKKVYGGRKTIISTSFGDATAPMFSDPPKCWMTLQGNFISAFFPQGVKAGVDYDFFNPPAIDPRYGAPVEVGGDIWAMFRDRPEVRAVAAWLARAEHLKAFVADGGALAPQKDVRLEWYGSDVDRAVARLLADAPALRFDGSDLMPNVVGTGAFWKEMTSWAAGTTDADRALKAIDAAWPKP